MRNEAAPDARLRRALLSCTGSGAPAAALALSLVAVFALGRVALALAVTGRLAALPCPVFRVVATALRMDLVVAALAALPLLLRGLLPPGVRHRRLLRILGRCHAAAVLWAASFLELAGIPFLREFDERPNRIFFEYLAYPREIFTTIAASFPGGGLLALGAFALGGLVAWRVADRIMALDAPGPAPSRRAPALVGLLAALALTLPVWSSWTVLLTWPRAVPDRLGASVASNGLASALAAGLTVAGGDLASSRFYGDLPRAEVLERLRRGTGATAFLDPATLRRPVTPVVVPPRPRNLVVVVAEGMSAGLVGCLGGQDLTPRFDAHARRGTLFTNLYANGDRTLRGLDAVLLGMPATPGRGLARLGPPPPGVWTLPAALRLAGYRTQFLYGGDRDFDEMWPFLSRAGVERVVDERDFPPEAPRSPWGVADGPVLQRAVELLNAPSPSPLFLLVLTTTFHDPFAVPPDAPPAPDVDPSPQGRAMAYVDATLGRFLDDLTTPPRRDDTVVLVVADHDVRTQGPGRVPVSAFRIAGLLLGPDVPARSLSVPAGQIDLASTLMPFLGVPLVDGTPGRNLLTLPPGAPGRAVMQVGHDAAAILGDRTVIYQPGLSTEASLRDETIRDGLALLLAPSVLWAPVDAETARPGAAPSVGASPAQ